MKSDTKNCPFCGETIKGVAVRCKHCHADLTAVASPPLRASLPASVKQQRILELLSSLTDKNMLVYEEDAQGAGRYQLLETVRQYTRDRLLESGESETTRERHREWFTEYATRMDSVLKGQEYDRWWPEAEPNYLNLRAALEWSLANQDARNMEAVLRLLRPLAMLWRLRGNVSEGREVYARVLAWVRQSTAATPTLAKLGHESLTVAGHLANRQGDYSAARALFEEALRLNRERDDPSAIALSLNNLGYVAMYEGDLDAARAHNEEALRVFEADGNPIGMGSAFYSLGLVADAAGRYEQARSHYEEALAVWGDRAEARNGVRYVLLNLGHVARRTGDFAGARSQYEESLRWFVEAGDRRGIAQCLEACASLAVSTGQAAALAARLYGAAEGLRETIGTPRSALGLALHVEPMNAARAALGEKAFDEAWASGRALTLEQAVEHALGA